MTVINYIGNNNPDGMSLGNTTSDLISFYGVTPVAQRAAAAQGAVSNSAFVLLSATMTSAATGWVFQTSTQANDAVADIIELQNRVSAVIVLVNELQASLVALGAIKGSAS